MDTTKENSAEDQACVQVASIVEMVAALEVDYERLDGLRSDKSDFIDKLICETGCDEACAEYKWQQECPYDASELAGLENAAGECTSEDEAHQRIDESPLSVEFRSDWVIPGEEMTAGEYRIVLCTGGPHVEIVGDLGLHGVPASCRVLYKDWGESGELFDFDRDAVLTYCRCFYFGE